MSANDFLAGGGAMGARIRAHDWSAAAVGPPEAWPPSLRTWLGLVLSIGSPAFLAWGPDLESFHNDACQPILGTRPDALGRPMREVWPEVWDETGPVMAAVLSGTPSSVHDLPLTLDRGGRPETTWWSFCCAPTRDGSGDVGGMLCLVHETSERMRTMRRLRFLDDLNCRLQDRSDDEDKARLQAAMARCVRDGAQRARPLADPTTNLFWVFDAEEKRLHYLSRACEHVWDESRDRLLQDWSRWTDKLHPDDRERVLDVFEGVLGGATTTCEYRIVCTDGSVRSIRNTLFPIRDEDGTVRQVAGLAHVVAWAREGAGVAYVVVDGDGPTRLRLTQRLQTAGYEVVVFSTARAFIDAAPVLVPGCAVLDVTAFEADGLALLRTLRERRIGLPVVATGARGGGSGVAVQAMKAGAVDYLEAPYTTEALLAAVASALDTMQDTAGHDRAAEDARARVAALSGREREVLDGLITGGTNKTIAKGLGISPRTVEVHRAHLMDRLGAHTLSEAVATATTGLQPNPLEHEVGLRRQDRRRR